MAIMYSFFVFFYIIYHFVFYSTENCYLYFVVKYDPYRFLTSFMRFTNITDL